MPLYIYSEYLLSAAIRFQRIQRINEFGAQVIIGIIWYWEIVAD